LLPFKADLFWLLAEGFEMNRRSYIALIAAALFAAQIPVAAKASTLTYNLSLNPIFGPEGGTGSFTIAAPPVGSSGTLTQVNGLTAMDFKIDGLDFALNSSSQVTYFYQGSNLVLASLFYGGTIGTSQLLSITLGSSGGYSFTDNAPGGAAFDTIGSVSISATPLPAALPLFASGLAAAGLIGWRRKRKAALAA
jgi:hypothetical protein